MKRKWIKAVAYFCATVLFTQSFSGFGTLAVEAAASDYASQSNVFLDEGGYKTVPYGTVTSDYMNTYKERADVLPKLENAYLTENYKNMVATVPTSDWASSVVFDQFSESLYVHPMAFRATSAGMEMANPEVVDITYYTDGEPAVESLLEDSSVELVMGGNGFSAVDARIDAATDWTYDISMKDSGGNSEILTTLAKGSSYVYYRFTNVTPTISLGAGATNMAIYLNDTSSNAIGVSVTETTTGTNKTHYYGVFASSGTTWTNAGGKLTANLPDGKDWITIAALPDGTQETFNLFAQYAANRISNTVVEWDYSEAESLVTTDYYFTTTNMDTGATGGNTIIALYPHQWRYAKDESYTGLTYETIRGTMKTMVGTDYTTYMTYNGILAAMPNPVSEEGLGTLKNQISYWWDYYENTCNGTYTEVGDWQYGGYDTYWMGKNFNKRADILYMANQIEDDSEGWTTIKDDILSALKEDLEYWFNPADCYTVEANPYITGFFFHYKDFGTLIGYNSSYSSDSELNDHHFHYGYWVKAAAAVAQYVPGWEKEWGALVYEMISDFANPNRDGTSLNNQRTDVSIETDTKYPFLRNFDIYEGHSWASGVANYEYDANGNLIDAQGGLAGGNNQESTSEAINAWSSLILWGETVGDERIRDLGVYLYTTEVAAVEEYYFDMHDEVFTDAYEDASGFDQQVVTRLFGGRYDHTAWWTDDPIEVTSIHMIPMTGSTLYFSKYPQKIKDTYDSIWGLQWDNYIAKHTANGWSTLTSKHTHHDLLAEFYAMADPQKAMTLWTIDDIDGQTVIETGESRPHTYGFIQSMIEFGTPDYETTGSTPLSMVFKDAEGNKTYVAQNFSDTEKDVYFSDGTYITVPANGSYAGDKTGEGSNPDLKAKVSYVLETYLQTTDKTGYECVRTEEKADAGEFTLVPEEVQGFTFDAENINNVLTGTLVENENNQVTLKAYYNRNTYTIQYETGEGTNAEGNPTEYLYGTTPEIAAPVREGYRFLGWYLDEAKAQKFIGITETTYGNLVLYADWISESAATYMTKVYMQKPARTGYECVDTKTVIGEIDDEVAFAYDGDTTGFTLNEAKSETEGIVLADNSLVLKVYYDRNSYHVSYGNMDGADNAHGNVATYVYGVGMDLIAPLKEGYTFGGWYTDENCTNGNEISTIGADHTGDVAVYAKWTETPEGSGEQGDTNLSGEEISVSYDADSKHVNITVNKSGLSTAICYINKYSTEADAKAAWEKAQNALPTFSIETFPGHLGIGLNVSGDSASKEITELTIEEGEYIVFGFNFGTGPAAFYYYKAGGSVTTSYTVNHYMENVSLGSYELTDSETVSNAAVGVEVSVDENSYDGFTFNDEVSIQTGTTTADGGLVLNLYYDRNRYDIEYNGLSDASNPNPSTYAHGIGLALEEPVRNGYSFAGWYTDEACTEGNEITEISDSSTGTVTVYAKWEDGENGKVNYTVQYYLQNEALNSYVELEEERGSFYVEEGTAVNAEIKTFTGFTHNPDAEGSVLSGSAEEGLQLKVYYNRNTYTVTYMNMEDVENPNEAVYVYGVGLQLKSPVKEGYTFEGWYTDAAFTPANRVTEITSEQTGAVTLYANWVKGIFAAQYTVEYYLETENLDGYELNASDTMKTYGEVGQVVEASVRKYHGFTFNSKASENVLQGTVLADDSLVLKVYYDRNTYNITYENMDGASFVGNAPTSYVFGTGAQLPTAQKTGYNFKGWYTDRNFYAGSELTQVSRTQIEDVTVYAKWAVANIPYQVKHYKQNATLDGYDEVTAETKTFLGEEGEIVTAHARDYDGFTYKEAISTAEGTVVSDGSLVLELYYDRDTYPVTYHNMENAVNHSNNTEWYAYDVVLTLKNPSKENYVFGGWYLDAACTEENKITQISAGKTGAVDVYAKWLDDTQAVSYKTEYYLQNLTMDGYDPVTEDTVEMHGVVGDTVLAPAREYTGFVKNADAEGACESIVLTEGSDQVLKVYYDRAAYGIVYHGIEDASNPNAKQYYYGIGLKLEEAYKDDYRFDGWFTAEECTDEAELEELTADQTGDVELWAKWTSKSVLTWNVETVKDYDYTGKKITPEIIVRDNETGHKLQLKKDYTVKYSNNVNAGTATIQITGKGNYTGSRFVTFEILPVNIETNKTTLADSIYKFTNKGKPVKVSPVLKVNGKKLKLNKDFMIDTTIEGSRTSYTDAGKYTLVLKGVGNYSGTVTTDVVLADKNSHVLISKAKITGLVKNIPYDQEKTEYTQALKLTYKGTELKENIHYELEYRNNTQAGTAQVIVKGLNTDESLKFTGSKTLSYKIQGQKITAKNITLDKTSYTYCGYKIEPVVTVMVNGVPVEADQYTVEYSNNLNKGKGTVTVTGMDGYQGTAKKTFAIAPLSLDDKAVSISVDSNVPYLKSGAVTTVSVVHNGEVLSENVDYTLKYSNNKRSGSALVTISGKGNYAGKMKKDFTVDKKSLAETTLIAGDISYNAKKNMKYYLAKPQLLDVDGSVLSAGKDYSKTFKYELLKEDGSYVELLPTSDVSMIHAGDEIKITVTGAGEYTESNSTSYRIIDAAQSISKARITIKPQVYTGKAVTISKADITKVEIKVNGSYMPLEDSDYEIVEGSYKNNIKKGTAKVTIKGVGVYGGTKEATFKIQSKDVDDTFFWARFMKWLLGE